MDEQRLASGGGEPSRAEQRQLGAEDERVVDVDDVEPLDPRQARDQRRVADREDRVDAVDDRRRRGPGTSPWAGAVKTST